MLTTLLYAASGAAIGFGAMVVVVLLMRAREETLRAALRGDFMEHRDDWGAL